ncbi:methyltransferase domain-containing protein [Verrucomicrobiales bacterium BCK34]|nr:methyltransferase domain-containing protein [Verrucomicrobiales bacterium BCK34]
MQRVVTPELLDSLPADDPAAMRSRQDLRRINFLMGNFRWLARALEEAGLVPGSAVVEVGSGDGRFAGALANLGYSVTSIDLAPRPRDIPESVHWIQGDLFEKLPQLQGDALIANLFWHHFEANQLTTLAPTIQQFPLVLANEPLRAHFPQALGAVLVPFINKITRHDLFVSIRAGFRPGELTNHWQLEDGSWEIQESTGLLGAYRLKARRRPPQS